MDQICQVCEKNRKKYKCPACNILTCSLACITSHKASSDCSGLKQVTKYIKKSEYTEKQGFKDYSYLSEVWQNSDKIQKKLSILKHKSQDQSRFKILKSNAKKAHNIDLVLLPAVFFKH